MLFISVVVGCNAFLNVWSMVYGMDSRQILDFYVYFTVDTEMMKQLHLDLRVSNISIKMMKDMMHVTLTSPGSVSSGFSGYQIVF